MDIAWMHCKPQNPNDKKGKLICNYCLKVMSGGVFRMKDHLAGISGNVAPCKEVPSDIKKEMIQHIRIKKKEKQAVKIAKEKVQEELLSRPVPINSETDESDEDQESRDIRIAMQESRREQEVHEQTRRDKYLGVGSSHGGGGSSHGGRGSSHGVGRSRSMRVQSERNPSTLDSYVQKKQSSKQPKIKIAMLNLKDIKKKIGRSVAKFFIFNHIPFNAAESPYYDGMVRDIAEAGPGIKAPTRYEISNTYLDEEVADYKQYLTTFHAFWDEYGCTLMCDGWTTQNRRSIINFLVYCPLGTVFIKSVDASDKFKSGNYICKLMKEVITEIGESRVVQVVTDNGANYKSAGKKLMMECPNLYWTPCAAHCIDLMLEDIAKQTEMRPTIEKSQRLTNFIYNHGWALSIMRKETCNGELIRPAITRFATHFLALQSILKHRHDLVRTVTTREWRENYIRLSRRDKELADEIYNIIFNGEYWTDITIITGIFCPLVKVLRMVDSDDKSEMGFLYESMDRAKEAIRNNVGNGYEKWWDIIDSRWERLLHRDIHAAGYFLNPHYQYHRSVRNDDEVTNGFRHVVDRLVSDATTRIAIKKEVARILLFFYLFYHVYLHHEEVKQMHIYGYLLVFGVPSALGIMNMIWFAKILKGLKKTWASSRRMI